MHNPPHPGHVLREWIPESMSVTEAAKALKISRVSLSKILNANSNISAEMAIRLSQWLGNLARCMANYASKVRPMASREKSQV